MVVYPKDHELTLKGWLTPNLIAAWRRELCYTWTWCNKCSLVSQRKYLTRSVKKTKLRIHLFPTPPSQMHADRTKLGGGSGKQTNRKMKHRLNRPFVVKRFQGGAKGGKKICKCWILWVTSCESRARSRVDNQASLAVWQNEGLRQAAANQRASRRHQPGLGAARSSATALRLQDPPRRAQPRARGTDRTLVRHA